jgi:Rrf2 family protein
MKLSISTDYAIRCILFLSMVKGNRVQAKEMAEALDISQYYIRNILINLKKAGLVESIQGVGGGYRLYKAPDKITVLDIINVEEEIMEERVRTVPASIDGLKMRNLMNDYYDDIQKIIRAYFADTTVKSLLLKNSKNKIKENDEPFELYPV